MKDIKEFHKIEEENHLFDLHTQDVSQIWDVLRVIVYNYFFIEGISYKNNTAICLIERFKSALRNLTAIPSLGRNKVLFFIYSRDIDNDGFWYDKISKQLIDTCSEQNRIIIELNPKSGRSRFQKFSLFLITLLIKANIKTYRLPDDVYEEIDICFRNKTHEPIKKLVLDNQYSAFIKYEKAISIVLKLLRPSQIFVSCDCQKAIYAAAKKINIQTCEMQHAGIVFNYPSYSYPSSINSCSNIIFADKYVKFGLMWGSGMNIPCHHVVLGNDYLYPQNVTTRVIREKKSILFVSTLIHRDILIKFCKEFVVLHPDVNILYKLHPSEYFLSDETITEFSGFSKIHVYQNEYPMDELLNSVDIVVMVYSSTFFEAISRNKIVALINKSNSWMLSEYVNMCKNSTFVDCPEDLGKLLMKTNVECNFSFYQKFDRQIAVNLLNNIHS